jgi:hypothetical protein
MAILRMTLISKVVSQIPPWNNFLKVISLFALSKNRTANISMEENPKSLKYSKASAL